MHTGVGKDGAASCWTKTSRKRADVSFELIHILYHSSASASAF
jgi:hypothetical protein